MLSTTLHRLSPLAAALIASTALGDTVTINASQDNTMYAESGALSNGQGFGIFTGSNGQGNERRALIQFDVAGNVPAGSTITNVTMVLTLAQTSSGPSTVSAHELSASWGEGTSDAPGGEGGGTAATTGDATWTRRFFDTISWTTPGGDFDAAASGSQVVQALGVYNWSSAGITADVQGWLDDPSSNHGWVLIGTNGTKRFASRNGFDSERPLLVIEFEPGVAFCNDADGSLASCPCTNPGSPDTGCDIAQGTGGVRLDVVDFDPDGSGGGTAMLVGSGYPASGTPASVTMRSRSREAVPVVFGDGLRCVASDTLVRVGAAFAIGGTSTRAVTHNSGPGTFSYQLWFRNKPAGFCTPDAFNTSSAYELVW